MRYRHSLPLAVLLPLLATLGVADEPAPVPSSVPVPAAVQSSAESGEPSDEASPPQELLDAILSIRQRQGHVLAGSILERVAEQGDSGDAQSTPESGQPHGEFARVLTRIAKRQEPSPPVAAHGEAPAESWPIAPHPDNDLALTLRQTARRLEQRGAELEDEHRYESADRLRRLARRVRREARHLLGPSVAP